MGSTSKKHKKDRDISKKRKHKSSRSSSISPDTHYRDHREKDRDREYREYQRDRERERRHHHHHHKKHSKEHRHRGGYEKEPEYEPREYQSDSSDCVEIPLAPPAPEISRSQQKSRSKSPIPEGGAGDCLSIAETNKLRAKLGLKPLEVEKEIPKDTSHSSSSKRSDKNSEKTDHTENLNQYKDDYGEFYHKPADNMAEKKQAEKIREKIKERREKRKLEDNLKIKPLGESSDEEDNNTKWIEKMREKERLKKDADKRAKLLEEMDAEFGISNLVNQETRNLKRNMYNKRDLSGLRVEHDMEQFTEGKEIILTLKDKEVLAEDEDTLVNVNMIDDERYKKNVQNKKSKPNTYGYNVYADETVDEYGQLVSRSILSKYDDEIGATKSSSFKIGEDENSKMSEKRRMLEVKSKLMGKTLASLNDTTLQLASEYYTPDEQTSFKKPKKKLKKIKKLKADDLLSMNNIAEFASRRETFEPRKRNIRERSVEEISNTVTTSDVKLEDDDEDLQHILAKARRLKQKESLIKKTLDIDVKDEVKVEPTSDDEDQMTPNENIVLDSTAEFCRTLGDIPTYGLSGNRDEGENEMMDFEQITTEIEIENEEIESNVGVWSSVNPEQEQNLSNPPSDLLDVAILDEEPDVSAGMAGALRLAMSKGYLEREENNRPSGSRMAHLQAKNYSIEDKTYGDDDKFGRRDRYHSGPNIDFKEKETFKPNVKLEYIDDSGRLLNSKEAFRYLSHKFHGKGPGKNKIEKRLKKMEQDTLMMKMNSTDTPLGTLNMLQQKQKETQSPYIVLSGSKQTHANSSIVKPKLK